MTANLVLATGGDLFVDTPTIAELFERPHRNVLRDINVLVENGTLNALKLERIGWTDSKGRTQDGEVLGWHGAPAQRGRPKNTQPCVITGQTSRSLVFLDLKSEKSGVRKARFLVGQCRMPAID